MAVSASVMQQLHRINRQKTDLKGQLDRGPKTILAAQRKLEAAEGNVEQIRSQHKQMRMDADRKAVASERARGRRFTLGKRSSTRPKKIANTKPSKSKSLQITKLTLCFPTRRSNCWSRSMQPPNH